MMTMSLILFSVSSFLYILAFTAARSDVKGGRFYKDMQYKSILGEMKTKNIKENLRYFTEYPHHPGSKRNTELAEYIADRWKKSGFDKTEIFRYNIYMSFPKSPGVISLRRNGKVKKKLIIKNEPPFDDSEKKGKLLYPFNAYSPKGSVTAEYIYGNYGRGSDFRTLRKLGIKISGKIMIFRYGKTARSSKVRRAEVYGAVGVIMFSDPIDSTYVGKEYPRGWMLNRYGVQRGTINRLSGDALSLGYPSKPKYFRIKASKYSGNPKIPSQPISYSTAYQILKFMKDDSKPLPTGFQGALNIKYVLSSGKGIKLTLKVSTELKTKESLTVCTSLYGSQEPDRYVMLGNHRDSWTYGAADPSSGTATMMEIVRSLGEVKRKTGWRPRRSIMACSWGAEEPGVLGSTEWADENHRFITENVAAYLNVDMAVEGNFTVRLKALNFVEKAIYRAAKLIRAPDKPQKTLYDDWLGKSSMLAKKRLSKPPSVTPTGSSDYKALWHTYGTTIADLRYEFSRKDYPMLSANGHYHTRYESFGWMSKHVDPKFIYHLAIGKLWAGISLVIADSTIIPFQLVTYTNQVKYYLNHFEISYESSLKSHQISLRFAKERLNALIEKAKLFHNYINRLDHSRVNPYELRSINNKLMNFERNFLLTDISRNKSGRHVIYSPARNALKETKFPGISEAIYFASKRGQTNWDEVSKQITLVIWCFDTANRSLNFDEWKY